RTCLDRTCRRGYRHRPDCRAAGETIPGLHPGRFSDCTPLWRGGARPFPIPPARAHRGRRCGGGERAARGLGVFKGDGPPRPPLSRSSIAETGCSLVRRSTAAFAAKDDDGPTELVSTVMLAIEGELDEAGEA